MATAPCITLTLLQHHSELPNLPLPLPRQHFWASRPKHAHLWPWADYLGCWGGFETRLMINRSSVTDLLFSLLPTAAGTLLHDLTLILALLFSLLGSRVSLRDWHGHYMSRNDRRTNAAQPLRRKQLNTALKWRAALWTTTRDDSMFQGHYFLSETTDVGHFNSSEMQET